MKTETIFQGPDLANPNPLLVEMLHVRMELLYGVERDLDPHFTYGHSHCTVSSGECDYTQIVEVDN